MLRSAFFFFTMIFMIPQAFASKVILATPAELKSKITSSASNMVLLDVRSPEEFNTGHIKGALLFNARDPLFKDKVSKLDKSKDYIIYCHSGGRSHFVSDYMSGKDFLLLTDMKGGIEAWKKEGLPVIK